MQYLSAILSHEIWTWETWKRVNASEAPPPALPPRSPVYTGYCCLLALCRIRTVTWYKKHHAGLQTTQCDLENKGYQLFEWWYIVVFLAPSRHLPSSLMIFASCDLILQVVPFLENKEKLTRHHRETFDKFFWKRWHYILKVVGSMEGKL